LALLPAAAGPILFGAVVPWALWPLAASAWISLAMVALRPVVFRAEVPIAIPPGAFAGVLFVAWAAIRAPASVCPQEAWLRVWLIGSAVAAGWSVANLAGRHSRWKWVIGVLLFVAAFDALYAWTQHLQGSRAVLWRVRDPSYGMRMGGTYVCPNHFANLVSMALAMAAAVATGGGLGWGLKLLAGYALIIIPWPLVLSQSRAGFATAVGGVLLVGWLWALRRSRRAAAAALLALPVVAAVAVALVWARAPDLRHRLEAAPHDIQARIQIWKGTLEMIRAAPLAGHGGGSFHLLDSRYVEMPPGMAAVHAHNDYLHTAAEYGLVGLGLAIAMGFTAFLALARAHGRASKPAHAAVAAGALGMLAVSAAEALVDFNFHIYANSMTLVAAVTATMSVFHAAGVLPVRLPTRAAARWMAVLVAAGAVIAAVVCVRAGVSQTLIESVAEPAMARGDLDAAERAYRRAMGWEPASWPAILGLADVAARRASEETVPARRQARIEYALRLCAEGRRLNPREPGFEHLESQLAALQGDRKTALAILERLVADYPNRPYLLVRLALELDRAGRLDEGLELLRRAVRLNGVPEETPRLLRLLEVKAAQRVEAASSSRPVAASEAEQRPHPPAQQP